MSSYAATNSMVRNTIVIRKNGFFNAGAARIRFAFALKTDSGNNRVRVFLILDYSSLERFNRFVEWLSHAFWET